MIRTELLKAGGKHARKIKLLIHSQRRRSSLRAERGTRGAFKVLQHRGGRFKFQTRFNSSTSSRGRVGCWQRRCRLNTHTHTHSSSSWNKALRFHSSLSLQRAECIRSLHPSELRPHYSPARLSSCSRSALKWCVSSAAGQSGGPAVNQLACHSHSQSSSRGGRREGERWLRSCLTLWGVTWPHARLAERGRSRDWAREWGGTRGREGLQQSCVSTTGTRDEFRHSRFMKQVSEQDPQRGYLIKVQELSEGTSRTELFWLVTTALRRLFFWSLQVWVETGRRNRKNL